MVVKVILDRKLASKVTDDELLELSFDEDVIVAVIHCSFLLRILHSRLYETRVLRMCLFLLLFLPSLWLLICVMQVPGDKNILSCKLPMLLLIRPDVDKHRATRSQDPMHLRQCLHAETRT